MSRGKWKEELTPAEYERRKYALGEENLKEWGELHRKYNTLKKREGKVNGSEHD